MRARLLALLIALPPTLATPRTAAAVVAEPGPITLVVDASEAPRRILHIKEQIPVAKAGPVTLHYPRWLPGTHGPVIPPLNLAGLRIRGAGKLLPWRRDDVDTSAFHVEAPAAGALEIEFDYLDAPGGNTVLATEKTMMLDWALVLLYPDAEGGRPAIGQQFAPKLRLPAGWQAAGALSNGAGAGAQGELTLPTVTLETLVDSPVLAGAHLRRYPLPSVEGAAHEVDVAGDSAASIEAPDELTAGWRRLPAEALALFGARHYRRYHFLLALSNQNPRSGGLEHHESSDNRAPERFLLDEPLRKRGAGLLAHEFTHSWNGKHRRPVGLCTPDFHTPMKDELLWVYEGLTTYWGDVLTARAGLRSRELVLDSLALTASDMEHRAGRAWRPLQDTAIGVASGGGGPEEWGSWRRGLDYYPESLLVWLEVDTTLRRVSGGKASLDDFARRFHGGTSGGPSLSPYNFDDIVATLESLAHHDWRGLLRARLDDTGAHAPLGGLTAGGWKLVWSDKDNEAQKAQEQAGKTISLRASLGLLLREDGTIVDVTPGMAAAKAGAAPGMHLRAVNSRKFSRETLEAALRATSAGPATIELLVENDEWFRTLTLPYQGGLRYPHLERVPSAPDVLGAILAPRVK